MAFARAGWARYPRRTGRDFVPFLVAQHVCPIRYCFSTGMTVQFASARLIIEVALEAQTKAHPVWTQMDVLRIIAQLRQEREQISEVILSLERLASSSERGPGRPPVWPSEITKRRRGRPPGSKNKLQKPSSTPIAD
jgi:hypothetical protein